MSELNAKKIIFFVNTSKFFISHRKELAIEAVRRGYKIAVMAPYDECSQQIVDLGFEYFPIYFNRGLESPLSFIKSIKQIRHVIKKFQPDILHSFSLKPILLGLIAVRKMPQIKVINTVTGLGIIFSKKFIFGIFFQRIFILMMRFCKSKNCTYTFQNQENMNYFLSVGLVKQNNTYLIKGSGVNTAEYQPWSTPPNKIAVLMASRMLWSKGVAIFVDAAELLRHRHPDVEFLLAGGVDADSADAIPQSVLEQWHKTKNINWLGYCSDIKSLFAKTTVFCLPSTYPEGVPKVLIEAAACGLPLITNNIAGCNDIVRDHINGLLLHENTATELANSISYLLNNAELSLELGKNGREIVIAEFSSTTVLDKTFEAYNANLCHREGVFDRGDRSLL